MAIIDVSVPVSKEAYELGDGVANFILHIKSALADGWQAGNDIPVVLTALMTDLAPAIQGIDQLGAEEKENVEAFVSAFLLGVKKAAVGLLKK